MEPDSLAAASGKPKTTRRRHSLSTSPRRRHSLFNLLSWFKDTPLVSTGSTFPFSRSYYSRASRNADTRDYTTGSLPLLFPGVHCYSKGKPLQKHSPYTQHISLVLPGGHPPFGNTPPSPPLRSPYPFHSGSPPYGTPQTLGYTGIATIPCSRGTFLSNLTDT